MVVASRDENLSEGLWFLKIAMPPGEKEQTMSSWTKKLEKWFSAVAFAEAGEHKTALEMVGLAPREVKESVGVLQTLNTTFAAAAFAEANCHDLAKEILEADARKGTFAQVAGLKGVRIWYGFVPAPQESFLETVGLKGVRFRFATVPI